MGRGPCLHVRATLRPPRFASSPGRRRFCRSARNGGPCRRRPSGPSARGTASWHAPARRGRSTPSEARCRSSRAPFEARRLAARRAPLLRGDVGCAVVWRAGPRGRHGRGLRQIGVSAGPGRTICHRGRRWERWGSRGRRGRGWPCVGETQGVCRRCRRRKRELSSEGRVSCGNRHEALDRPDRTVLRACFRPSRPPRPTLQLRELSLVLATLTSPSFGRARALPSQVRPCSRAARASAPRARRSGLGARARQGAGQGATILANPAADSVVVVRPRASVRVAETRSPRAELRARHRGCPKSPSEPSILQGFRDLGKIAERFLLGTHHEPVDKLVKGVCNEGHIEAIVVKTKPNRSRPIRLSNQDECISSLGSREHKEILARRCLPRLRSLSLNTSTLLLAVTPEQKIANFEYETLAVFFDDKAR